MCSENAVMSQADRSEGFKPGGLEVMKIQMVPTTRVMSC
jgi:hypothetical protein